MVELFIDYNSPPSRSVLAFCILNNIPYTVTLTTVLAGGTRTPEYTLINPNRTVPCIRDGEFVLYESNAILQYLADKYVPDSHWYPKDPVIRAKIDLMLHWHHWNVRYGCSGLVYREIVKPLISGRPLPDSLREELQKAQRSSFSLLNKKAETGWLAGTELPSLADLIVSSELAHLMLLQFDYNTYPALKQWFIRMLEMPGIKAAHEHFFNDVGTPHL
mmetsp:Transcript_15705/g.28668  ORF Transcript_15705/g.28668 Transcript_15705/m.28668 type:complete len:218 (+) Transcript_15705:45-698(+)